MLFFDAHNHLHDNRLLPYQTQILSLCKTSQIAFLAVNGTSPSDWSAVQQLCQAHPECLPSYGVHPWFVDSLPLDWQDRLLQLLATSPHAAIGEIGLDRWKTSANLPLQKEVFLWQLRLATQLNLPVTIHCLRAWDDLLPILRKEKLPPRGFLLHAYGGPSSLIAELQKLGAYFSFNANFLDRPRKLSPFSSIPLDRLFLETDAPDMRPPASHRHPFAICDELNHPLNLPLAYSAFATFRSIPLPQLTEKITANFFRFFTPPPLNR